MPFFPPQNRCIRISAGKPEDLQHFEDAISKGHEKIAVFDDDFILSNSFDHRFSRLIETIGEKWEVIYLGASQWLWESAPPTNFPFYKPDENTNGSFAVIYRKSVFKEILGKILY